MFNVGAVVRDAIKSAVLGENVDSVLQQAGLLCQSGSHNIGVIWNTTVERALDDCSDMMRTCLKVAYIATLLTTVLPFLFGTLTSSCAFFALTGCAVLMDMQEVMKRLSQLIQGRADVLAPFQACHTMAARIEFMLKPTTFLQWMPTNWIETGMRWWDFLPAPGSGSVDPA